jgi:DNA-binding GntR family transcriptional regulator
LAPDSQAGIAGGGEEGRTYPAMVAEEKTKAARGASRLLMAEDIEQGTINYLAETLGFTQAGYQDSITARSADDNEPQLFGMPTGAAMFVIFRTAFTEDGTVTRVTVTLCPADRNQFRYSYGKVAKSALEQQYGGLDY